MSGEPGDSFKLVAEHGYSERELFEAESLEDVHDFLREKLGRDQRLAADGGGD